MVVLIGDAVLDQGEERLKRVRECRWVLVMVSQMFIFSVGLLVADSMVGRFDFRVVLGRGGPNLRRLMRSNDGFICKMWGWQ